jgi:pimeloyl-ACP methyl ester carboxylesterase
MPKVRANGIDIEYESLGDPSRPAVILIMGLGMQLVAWPDDFCQALADAGYRVIRFDNRDIGLSSHLDHLRTPSLPWFMIRHKLGFPVRAPYTLDDMAADTVGLMDALGIAKAHIVGVSMGGMIAQVVAGRFPERVLSLASIMSTTGARGLPGPTPAARNALLRRPPRGAYSPEHRDALVRHFVGVYKAIGSPGYPMTQEDMEIRIRRGLDRSIHPIGFIRQIMAIGASPDRSPMLRGIDKPALVVHGVDDPLVPIACGRDTAAKIPGATLVEVPGMGHDLAPGVCDRLLQALVSSTLSAKSA